MDAARTRASRACDACKIKRLKCEGVQGGQGDQRCRTCRETGQNCTYEAPVRKRGPTAGFKKRRQAANDGESTSTPDATISPDTTATTSEAPGPCPESASSGPRQKVPLLGLPRQMIDELLAVYFTHVHNVWPIIYKPAFSPYSVSPLLLLSMLAISACMCPDTANHGYDAVKLFRMAESALPQSRMENRVDIVQAMILLSLRQTGCGDKGAAFIYASRACGMVLNMGLNLSRKGDMSTVDEQIRSRVLWNCYVLDKSLAEETGRSYLLPYRRCSTPFPSVDEVDELEVWPPSSISSAPLPRSVRRVTARRGHVISCFIWTCRLAMVVEDILDLDSAPPLGQDEWDRQFRESNEAKRGLLGEEQEAERISEQLRLWRQMLPSHLTIVGNESPLPHHVIGLAWHTTATIMLHSRFVVRMPFSSINTPSDWNARSHEICSEAARSTVDMLRLLDKHGLLEQVSSDVIHILSLATLFDAFDSTSSNLSVAQQAREDFQQCCTWLRLFSSSWPAASAHKLFFEAVIQGGLKLVDPNAGSADQASPLQHTSSLESPSLTGGLQAVRRHLSISHPREHRVSMSIDAPQNSMANGMLQLPHLYWNHLSNTTLSAPQPVEFEPWDNLFNFNNNEANAWSSDLTDVPTTDMAVAPLDQTTNATQYGAQTDQLAISEALISFMAEMAKSN